MNPYARRERAIELNVNHFNQNSIYTSVLLFILQSSIFPVQLYTSCIRLICLWIWVHHCISYFTVIKIPNDKELNQVHKILGLVLININTEIAFIVEHTHHTALVILHCQNGIASKSFHAHPVCKPDVYDSMCRSFVAMNRDVLLWYVMWPWR